MVLLNAKEANTRKGGPTYSFGHRLKRSSFRIVWSAFCCWTPVPLHGWRRAVLRLFGAKLASSAKIYPTVRIWYPANLEMAEHSCLGPDVNCYSMNRISLGPYALASQGAYLCAGTHDVDDPDFQLVTKPIALEANAWVAAEAFVGPGVTVGEGAVLGARGVAFRNLDANTIYAGNPAKPLRMRKLPGVSM